MSIKSKLTAFTKNHWRAISRFTGAEMSSLLLTALAGFLMVRHLTKESYGIYSFLTTGTTLIIGLSEVGMSHCFLPLVGYINIQIERVNAVYALFRSKRFKLFLTSIVLVTPFLLFLMQRNGWLNTTYVLSTVAMLVAGYFAVNEQLYRQRFTALHESKLISTTTITNALLKAVWTIGALYLFKGGVLIILLAGNGILGSLAAIMIYRRSITATNSSDTSLTDTSKLNEEFKKLYNPLRLSAFLYILYASFGNLIIGFFGKASTIADVNATGRLAMFLVIIDRIAGTFIMPRLAQAKNFSSYKQSLFVAHALYLAMATAIILSAWLLPDLWILLIGDKYLNIRNILWIAFAGSLLMNLAGFTFTCLTSRGFTSKQLPILIGGVLTQIIAIKILGMDDALHVFIINLITASTFAIGNLLLMFFQIKRQHNFELSTVVN